MKIRTLVIAGSLAICTITAQAQYKEMSKVEALAQKNDEQQMLAGLSAHLGVPAETLKQEKASNSLNFGQLYLAHVVAKAAKADIKTIISDSKSKLWPAIIEERKVDKKQLAEDLDQLEKSFKNLKSK